MQVDDLATVLARRQVDSRDRATRDDRADKPEEPERRSADVGGAVTQVDEKDRAYAIDPSAIADQTDNEHQPGHLIDLLV